MAGFKLGLEDAINWLNRELDGYEGVKPAEVPSYRAVRGQPSFYNPYNGWCPIIAKDELFAIRVSTAHFYQPLAVLEQLVDERQNGSLQVPHSSRLNNIIVKQLGFEAQTVIFLARASVWGIVDRVRNLIVNWSLELEKAGVIGEGLSFNLGEKDRAASVTHNYFAQNIGVAGNVDRGSSVHNDQAAGAGLDLAKVHDLSSQLGEFLQALPTATAATVQTELDSLNTELAKGAPDQGRLRQVLQSLKAACEGAAGNIIAAGAVEAIKAVFR